MGHDLWRLREFARSKRRRVGSTPDDLHRAGRRALDSAWAFTAARVCRGCFGSANGRTSIWPGERAGETGRLQPADPHECFANDSFAVHCCAIDRGPDFFGIVQHAPAALGADRGPAEYDSYTITS